jgi:hypothetical protein
MATLSSASTRFADIFVALSLFCEDPPPREKLRSDQVFARAVHAGLTCCRSLPKFESSVS